MLDEPNSLSIVQGMENEITKEQAERLEKKRLWKQAYNKRYIRKSPKQKTVEAVAYESVYKLAHDTAMRMGFNGGQLLKQKGVHTVPSSARFAEYVKRHNRSGFIAYIDKDTKEAFQKFCKDNKESPARLVEQMMRDYLNARQNANG